MRHASGPLSCGLLALVAVSCGSGVGPAGGERSGVARRVVVMAPAVAEMLTALELGDRVVGVGQFGPWPAGLDALPEVGGYDSPNVERVLALRADMLLSSSSEAAFRAHQRLEELGVRVLALDTSTLEGVFESLERLGDAFEVPDRADRLEAAMREDLEAIAARTRELARPRVLFVVGRDPLFVAGPGSHVDEMIRAVGGTNVVHDAASPYQQVSVETVLERAPEIIIDTSDNRREAIRGRAVGPWSRWPFLPAVRDDRVFHVAPGRLVIPGMRMVEMTELMGHLIHPEVFGEPSFDSAQRTALQDAP